jgi:pimeloyl-ACP methyl ester carboxylesterase
MQSSPVARLIYAKLSISRINAVMRIQRREMLRLLGSAGMASALAPIGLTQTRSQPLPTYVVDGSGPTVIVFDRMPAGYYKALTNRYRVIVVSYPETDPSQGFVDSFTPDRVCADILAVADAEHAERFAWFGFSWGAVVGLQLAVRTNRLTALALGGWPPLGGQYRDTLGAAIRGSESTGSKRYVTFYRNLQNWLERDAVSRLSCPRLIFVGRNDHFVAEGYDIRIGPIIIEHREELQRLGWTVRIIEGIAHDLGGRPDIVIPLLREFLDPLLHR